MVCKCLALRGVLVYGFWLGEWACLSAMENSARSLFEVVRCSWGCGGRGAHRVESQRKLGSHPPSGSLRLLRPTILDVFSERPSEIPPPYLRASNQQLHHSVGWQSRVLQPRGSFPWLLPSAGHGQLHQRQSQRLAQLHEWEIQFLPLGIRRTLLAFSHLHACGGVVHAGVLSGLVF